MPCSWRNVPLRLRNKGREQDREALAQDMKAMYRAEAEEEAKEALRERWGAVYPRGVARWEAGAFALLAFLRGLRPIQRYLSPTNQLERMSKEVKRRTRAVEVVCSCVVSGAA